jgi:ArsR family metal-binding transcriptional regulator
MGQKIEIIITITPDGSINVTGPIHDKTLCYGLLEAAKDAIREHHVRLTAAHRIIPAVQIPKTN